MSGPHRDLLSTPAASRDSRGAYRPTSSASLARRSSSFCETSLKRLLWRGAAVTDRDRHAPRMNVRARLQQSFAVWIVLTAALAAAAAGAPVVAAVGMAGAIAMAAWRWPDLALEMAAFAVLAIRPSLDIFSERRFGLSEFAPNPAMVFGLAILLVASVIALRRARDGRFLWPNQALLRPHLWLLGAYGIGFVSGGAVYGLAGAATGLRELVRVASVVAAFLTILWWVEADAGRYQRGWAYLIAGMLVPVAVAAWQWATRYGSPETEGLNRLQGTFSHSNSLGQYLAPFIL